jgi:transcriptional regulator with XRE-family HTH domain
MTIHDRIRKARVDAGLSVNALAGKLKISSTAVWNWDHANTTPRPEMLEKVAEVLGVDAEYLRTGREKDVQEGDAPKRQNETLDQILADARARIAGLLGIKDERVRLEMSLS